MDGKDKDMYKPNGKLQGDSRPMKDCGTEKGVTDTYGADVGLDATNRLGSLGKSTNSDGKEGA